MKEKKHRLSEAGRETFQHLLPWCLSGPGPCLAKGMETECGAESLPRTCSRQETEAQRAGERGEPARAGRQRSAGRREAAGKRPGSRAAAQRPTLQGTVRAAFAKCKGI